jgi:hypothetical protein
MGTFLPLFSIVVEHSYAVDMICRQLDFVPSPWTAALVHKAGLVVKKRNGGIIVFYDRERSDAAELYLEGSDDGRGFCYKVFCTDPNFMNITSPAIFRQDAILHFHSRKIGAVGPGPVNLHSGEWVSDDDFEPLDSPQFAGLFDARDRCRKPHFCVTVGEDIQLEDSALNQNPTACPELRIRFRSRETLWKYYLIGDMNRKDIYISDKNGEVTFVSAGDALLSDNRTAAVFVSDKPLPLKEISECNFQLREKGPANGKVLIKRLPVASALLIDRNNTGDTETAVSEIFIHC